MFLRCNRQAKDRKRRDYWSAGVPAGSMPEEDANALGVRLTELRVQRPRQWGACWLSCVLWQSSTIWTAFGGPALAPPRERRLAPGGDRLDRHA